MPGRIDVKAVTDSVINLFFERANLLAQFHIQITQEIAIQRHAEAHRFSVVRDFCGHGVGRIFHDAPSILHYGRPEDGPVMREGMFFTVEPMINAGRYEVKVLSDGWTAVTKDRSLSAQFEHTVGVTATGYEIFTISPAGLHQPPYDLSLLAQDQQS